MALTYEDFIQRLNIQDLLVDAGYVFNRKDGLRYPTYAKLDGAGRRIKGDKFVVNPRRQTCFQPPEQKVYNVISFIKHHPQFFAEYREGMKLDHLVNLVCNRLLDQPVDHSVHQIILPSQQERDFDIKDYELTDFRKYDFDRIKQFYSFFKSRGIDVPTQRAFSHHFYLASLKREDGKVFKNLSFPLRIPGRKEENSLKEVVGFEERGRPRLDGSSGYKGKARGSNSSEGLWMASPNGTPIEAAKKVLWFESAFDAMAYYQLHAATDPTLRDAVFLSTGGAPTVMQYRGVISTAKDATHHLCFDNDLAGNQFVENFKNEAINLRLVDPQQKTALLAYQKSLSDPEKILSGDMMLLPEKLQNSYGKWEAAEEEWYTTKNAGMIHPDDLKVLSDKATEAKEDFRSELESALSSITQTVEIVREVPKEGSKDWNDLLLKEKSAELSESTQVVAGGIDLDGDGIIEGNESDQRKTSSLRR